LLISVPPGKQHRTKSEHVVAPEDSNPQDVSPHKLPDANGAAVNNSGGNVAADQASVQSRLDRLKTGFEKVADQSQKIVDTELLLFGGSIAILFGTNYHRPSARSVRKSYFSFLGGWLAFSISMYYGYAVRSTYLAFLLTTPRTLDQAFPSFVKMNHDSTYQARWFYAGLVTFACWLVFYLIWWVFTDTIKESKS
jgi:hypothetical protein